MSFNIAFLDDVLLQFNSFDDKSFKAFRQLWSAVHGPSFTLHLPQPKLFTQQYNPVQPDGPIDLNFTDPEYAPIQQCFVYIITKHIEPFLHSSPSSITPAVFLLYSLYYTQYPPISSILFPASLASSLVESLHQLMFSDCYICLSRLFHTGAIVLYDSVCPPFGIEHPSCTPSLEDVSQFPLTEALPDHFVDSLDVLSRSLASELAEKGIELDRSYSDGFGSQLKEEMMSFEDG
ncbi:hypothetical protein P9112_006750 [Eukaryota sp. TZLM1-RC]